MAVLSTFKNVGYSNQGPGGTGLNATQMWGADPDIAAQGAQNLRLTGAQGEQARLTAAQADQFRQNRFSQALGAFGNLNSQGGGGIATGQLADIPNFRRTNLGTAPVIHGGPIWSEQAIRQNVNANNAKVDQGTASNNMSMAGQLAGQGFGARSPLTRALEQMGSQSAMGQKADYGRQFTQTAREQNANFGLQSQQAQERQYANRAQEDLGYGNLENQAYGTRQNAFNQQLAAEQSGRNAQTSLRGSLANALLGLVG